jgi:hypothetical protein
MSEGGAGYPGLGRLAGTACGDGGRRRRAALAQAMSLHLDCACAAPRCRPVRELAARTAAVRGGSERRWTALSLQHVKAVQRAARLP